MNKNSVFHRKKYIFVGILLTFFYLWLASRIPYTHDDWDWGLDMGIQRWLTAEVNSRYLGNFLEVVMTRSEILKTLIMGTGYCLIPCMIASVAVKESGNKNLRWLCFVLSNILLLTMDQGIWKQTYGWVAGYANFVISGVFMLFLVQKGLDAAQNRQSRLDGKFLGCAGLFAVSFLGQLFLENLAIFMTAFFLLSVIWYYRKHKAINKQLVFMLAGSILGLAVVFSNGIYITLLTTGKAIGNYRQLNINASESPAQMLRGFLVQAVHIPYRLWETNLIISLSVLGVMTLCVLKNTNRKTGWTFAAVNCLLGCFFIAGNFETIVNPDSFPKMAVHAVINVFYFAIIGIEILAAFRKDRTRRAKLLTMWILAPAVILPLVATSELGARLFFTSNIFVIVFIEMAICGIWDGTEKSCKWSKYAAVAILAVFVLGYGVIYSQIGACKDQRDAIIAQAIENNEKTIVLPPYPFEEYMWHADPENEERLIYFKAFYQLAPDVEIIFDQP